MYPNLWKFDKNEKLDPSFANLAPRCGRHFRLVPIVTFTLSFTYTYQTPADAQVKRKNIHKIKNVTWGPNNYFDFLNVCPFSPGGFFTFLVALTQGASSNNEAAAQEQQH